MRIILTHFLLIGAAFGNYAGKKGNPTAVLPKHPGPKIVNPSNPIDPSRVKTIDPNAFGGSVVDNIPPFVDPPVVDSQIVGRGANVFGLRDQRRPFPNELLTDVFDSRDHRPSFPNGPRPDAFDPPFRKSPSFENLNKVPIGGPDQDPFDFSILDPRDYGKSVPRPGTVDPHVVDRPIQKSQTYDKSQKVPAIDNVLANPVVKSDGPGTDAFDPSFPRPTNRKSPSYDNSHLKNKPGGHIPDVLDPRDPIPPIGKPPGYSDPSAGHVPDVFHQSDGPVSDGFDPRFPGPPIRKAPSYDNTHLKDKPVRHIPDLADPRDLIPPIGKPPGYDEPSGHVPDVFHPSGGSVSDGFDPHLPGPPIRKAPSYDNAHLKDKPILHIPDVVDPRDTIPPKGKLPGYSDLSTDPGPDVFHPSGGPMSDGVDPRLPGPPIRKAPSYDNTHLKNKPNRHISDIVDTHVPIPPIGKPPGSDVFHPNGRTRSHAFDPSFPRPPIRKAPSYDNSHLKDKPISHIPDLVDPRDPVLPIRKSPGYSDPSTGPGPDIFHPNGSPWSDGFNPRVPGPPIRKAPSYDNTHLKNKPGSRLLDVVEPHIPIPPIGKPPGYSDPSTGPDPDVFHPSGGPISDGFDPGFPGQPIRKAPSYDNAHLKNKPVSRIPDVVDPFAPHIPKQKPGYDKLREKPFPVIPGHGDRFGNVSPGINPIKKTGYGNVHLGKEGRDPLGQKPGGYDRTKVKKAGISQIDNPVNIPMFGGQDELSRVIDANLRQGISRGDQLPHEQVGALRLPERLKIPPSRPVLPPKRTYSKKKRRYLSTLKKKWLRN